jgi:DNA-directed RNA polymerase subunit RPC12/RpoP
MKNNTNLITCPNCNNKFSIFKNRAYQIRRKYAPFWFFDAVKQFEHFNEVACPVCKHRFFAKEARLFYFFKSPFTVVVICLLFLILAIAFLFKLK